MSFRGFLLLFLLLLSWLTSAQDILLNSRLLTVSDGMVSRNARAVATDIEGNVWIATDLGVSFFNGLDVGVPEDLPEQIRNGRFDHIFCSQDGKLWFLNKTTNFTAKTSEVVLLNMIIYDPLEKNIVELDVDAGSILQIKEGREGKLWIWNKNNEIYSYTNILKLEQQIEVEGLISIQEVANRRYFFYEHHIEEFKKGVLEKRIQLKYPIRKALALPDGNIYVVNDHSYFYRNRNFPMLGKWNLKTNEIIYSSVNKNFLSGTSRVDQSFLTAYNEKLILILSGNIHIVNPMDLSIQKTIEAMGAGRSIAANVAINPKPGQYFIATNEGLLLVELSVGKAKNYFAEESFSLRGMGKLNKDSLLIATYSGVKILNLENEKYSNLFAEINYLFGIAEFNDHELVAGLHANHYFLLDKGSLAMRKIDVENINILDETLLPQRLENGEVWFATTSGPYKYAMDEQEFFEPAPIASSILSQLPIRSISKYAGQYYFCTENGLYISDEDLVPDHYKALGDGIITDVYVDDKYNWVSTFGSGLKRVNQETGQIVTFNKATDGFPNDYIYSIHNDDLGYLWLPSNNGLIRFEMATANFQVYKTEDGFVNYEYNNGSNFVDEDGRVYLGGTDGLSSFDPADFVQAVDTVPFKVVNMSYSVGDELSTTNLPITTDERINLPANYLSFSFSIHSTRYAIEESIKYIYKIPNYANEWTTIESNKLTLNRLPFGNHDIIIKPLVNGHRKADLINVRLKVNAPFYLQTSFLMLLALALILLTILYIRWRTSQLRKRNLLLSQQVKERTVQLSTRNKDLVELNDTRDRLFGIIAHDLRGPLIGFKDLGMKIKFLNSNKRKEDLEKLTEAVQENYENLSHLLDNLLHWISTQRGQLPINISPVFLQDHIEETLQLYDQTINQKNIRVIKEGPTAKLLADEDGVDILLRNLVNNAIKYSKPNGKIWISTFENENEVSFVVEDEGIGMGEEELKNLFLVKSRRGRQGTRGEKSTGLGLPLCMEFVTLMNGRIEVKSELGKGTRFVVSLPKFKSET